MSQNAAPDPSKGRLTARHQAAIAALMTGASITAAANAAGVDRRTMQRWLRDNEAFNRELEHRQEEAFASVRPRVSAIVDEALHRLHLGVLGNDADLIDMQGQVLDRAGVFRVYKKWPAP